MRVAPDHAVLQHRFTEPQVRAEPAEPAAGRRSVAAAGRVHLTFASDGMTYPTTSILSDRHILCQVGTNATPNKIALETEGQRQPERNKTDSAGFPAGFKIWRHLSTCKNLIVPVRACSLVNYPLPRPCSFCCQVSLQLTHHLSSGICRPLSIIFASQPSIQCQHQHPSNMASEQLEELNQK